MPPRLHLLAFGLFATPALLGACGDEAAGSGSLKVSISGEQAALTGYPVGRGDDAIAFSDGWTVQFDKILISLSGLELKTADGDDAALKAGPVIADLHQGKPPLWKFDDIPAQRWDRVGYEYQPPTAQSKHANSIDSADIEMMADKGYSLYVAGTAQKHEREVAFRWGFPFSLTLSKCVNGLDATEGLVVAENRINVAQVTVHMDHLFLDSFASDEAKLRFDPMAAIAPTSAPLQLDDLAKQNNLTDLKNADGKPLEIGYDPGSAFSPVPKNLEDYVIAAASTTGHWNGEGHCVYTRK